MRFTKSIRWRLQLWLAFLLVVVLSGFGVAVYELQRGHQLNQIDEELKRRVAAVSSAARGGPPPDFGPGHPRGEGPGFHDFEPGPRRPPPMRGPPGPGEMWRGPREVRLSAEVAGLFDETRTNAFYFAVWSRMGTLLKHSTNSPPEVPVPEHPGDTLTHTRMRETWREAFHFTEMGDCILAGRSIGADLLAMHRFSLWLLAAGGSVLAFGLGGGWWLTTRAIRPVERISAAASRISGGNLSERIDGAAADNELGRLAGVLNSTFARLETAFAQQKQFTADASHELRTPLAILISEAQMTLARERTAAEYREAVEACLDTAQQMRRLTESLLELARLDANQGEHQREPLDLAEIVEAAMDRLRPLAAKASIEFHCDLQPVAVVGNAEQINQVITNLLTNAIHYNKPRGVINISTQPQEDAAILTVADTGLGIAAEDLPQIFERFYRADKSRARANGRAGLGLAICKAIAEAHGGQIEVSSQAGVGTTFTVRLPPRLASDQELTSS